MGFWHCNCIVVFDKNKEKLLFCKRAKNPYKGLLNFVGGKVEPEENSENAAYRELFEETGINTDSEKLIPVYELYCKENVPALYSCYINIIPNRIIIISIKQINHTSF